MVLPTSRAMDLRDLLVALQAERVGLAAELDAVDDRRLPPVGEGRIGGARTARST
jgi:hypothetical protein